MAPLGRYSALIQPSGRIHRRRITCRWGDRRPRSGLVSAAVRPRPARDEWRPELPQPMGEIAAHLIWLAIEIELQAHVRPVHFAEHFRGLSQRRERGPACL